MTEKHFQLTTGQPTVPLGNNIIVSCAHFDIPKKEGGTLVSVNGGGLMSGLCDSCWTGIMAQLARIPDLEREVEAKDRLIAKLTDAKGERS